MNEMEFKNKLQSISKEMEYPPTTEIAASVMKKIRPVTQQRFISKRLTWSLTFILILIFSLFAIPPVRAAILEFIQIGIVRIFPQPVETITPALATKTAVPSLVPFLNSIAGETTLEEAQQSVPYPILIPTYPTNLGKPNLVFVQDAEGAMTILVWLDPQQPERVLLSLHFIPQGSWAIDKGFPINVWETRVNGEKAFWGEGPYPLRLYNGDLEFMRLIDGHVLIWEEDDITYRLEIDVAVEEAVKIAESLQPVP